MPHNPEIQWDEVRRLLVMRLDNIGDIIMTSPALQSLRLALPRARISLMTSRVGSLATPLLPWIDETLSYTSVWQDAFWEMPLNPAHEAALVEQLREKAFDAAIILTSFSQSPYPPAYACYLAGIPLRIGQSKEFGGSVLSHWIKSPPDQMHGARRNLHLLSETGIPSVSSELKLAIPPEVHESAEEILAVHGIETGEGFIAVAPGASCMARIYPQKEFIRVARRLATSTGLPIVILGSEREISLRQAVEEEPLLTSIVGQTTVPEFAAIVRRAALVVSNDSAAMHVADAFRIPMIVLFSGSDYEEQWAPQSAPAVLLRRPTHCAPCYLFRCPTEMECLAFTPEEIAEHALQLLGSSSCYGTMTRSDYREDVSCET